MKKVFKILLTVSTVLFFISCGSKPAPEETTPEAPVVEEQTVVEQEDEEPAVTDEDADEGLDEDAYAALIAKIEDARKSALEAGADEKAPDQLKSVDDLYASLKDSGLEENADMLIARYNLLANYIKAKDAKDEIDNNGYASYAQSNYDAGCADLEKVEAAFADGSELNSSISESAQSAYSNFNTVLTIAYKRLAKDERELAYEAKKKADSVKAGVSQKERYNTAADDFKTGDSLYAMQAPKKALNKYTSAKDQFNQLYNEVSEKRAAAQAAIEAAKQRVKESEEFAVDADATSPITDENVEGIEDEEAVLLEEDTYEDPEEAEAEIAEDIDDVYVEVSEEITETVEGEE